MEVTAAGGDQTQSTGDFFNGFCLGWRIGGVAAFDAVLPKGNQFFSESFHLSHVQVV